MMILNPTSVNFMKTKYFETLETNQGRNDNLSLEIEFPFQPLPQSENKSPELKLNYFVYLD